ncbi:YggS family pyridoxal phosphate-dependent enzyme [Agriterribacter sp.]|uniref:YggS family pyridoxal phosphate-dependent enzyme n=1 Tax=Agriterribacter sp. TaxID=2821509 RepID=UPI002C130F7A|nr:YggS family pyridoxal phosphate-dependent enzyme [Agriterribacter sp.]HRP58600.1 YggS family pyridoxal phosphate-dependent enzyme [Agriterribacter sp.]
MSTIIENLAAIKQRIRSACDQCGRDEGSVKLLLATKTVSAENIRIALQQGETLIGENKVQELKEKFEALKDIPHETHFIGHLQTNKIKEVIRYAGCIQSVDRLELAQKLNRRLQYEGRSIDVLIQVNTSAEESKFGVAPENAVQLVKAIAAMDAICIKGLMTIGIFSAETEKVRKCFRLLKNIQDQIKDLNLPNVTMDELSMGMSGDLETAISEGATIVRVGTAVFGRRAYPDSYYWNENPKE